MLPGAGAASLRSPHPPERAAADTAAAPGANNTPALARGQIAPDV